MPYSQQDIQPKFLKFEEIQEGFEAQHIHTITQQDVQAFAELTGDFNPIHLDPKFARRTSFGKPIVHGMFTSSFVSTMIGMLIPGPGALWTSQKLTFIHPAFVGDEIKVVACVKKKSPGTRTLIIDITITNQSGTKLVEGESTVQMLELSEEPTHNRRASMDEKQVIMVTGGSRGIGAAIVRKLVSEGHTVVLNYLQAKDEAQKLVDELEGQPKAIQGDVSCKKSVETMFAEIKSRVGPVRGLVHCASPIPVPSPFESLDWESVQTHLETQVRGAFNCVKCILPQMIQAQSGAIVFLGSIFADGTPPVQQTAYVIAKAAVAAFARSLAVEYGPKGIRVNVVSPGMTHTEMIANIPNKVKMLTKMNTPLRRLADPSDIASVVAFLLSHSARHITGENIRVCGGLAMS